jgi:NRAMP (natural resistance-associated macrophage protein)-like metal ion transporter
MASHELQPHPASPRARADPAVAASKPGLVGTLGPGLITGASDDDPSGIGTYSQAGAQLGFSISWTMVITLPLMVAIQEISARLGRTTGLGIAGNLRRHYPAWLVQILVVLLVAANVVTIGADLGAMADSVRLLVGGPVLAYVAIFAVGSALAQIFVSYARYVRVLKWLSLSLFVYVGALAVVKVPWEEVLKGLFVPLIDWNRGYFTTLVAIAGTTISPYMFFWQAAQEAEDVRVKPQRQPLLRRRWQAPTAFARIRADTLTGMTFSNLIAVAIMITTAATLHGHGITQIDGSAQAAQALAPIAGPFAETIFALGIVGTGLLAVPVMAGSASYAVSEALRWRVGLARKPNDALPFYGALAVATLVGAGLNFIAINPIAALYWSAVINGVVAVPIMVMLMLMTARRRGVMGSFPVAGWLKLLGWAATAAMAASVVGMAVTG